GEYPADVLTQHMAKILGPVAEKGLGAGNHHLVTIDLYRKNAMALGIGKRHDGGDGARVHLQRVDVKYRLAGMIGQPLSEMVQIQGAAALWMTQVGFCHDFQRMQVQFVTTPRCAGQLIRIRLGKQSISYQLRQDIYQSEEAVFGGWKHSRHERAALGVNEFPLV